MSRIDFHEALVLARMDLRAQPWRLYGPAYNPTRMPVARAVRTALYKRCGGWTDFASRLGSLAGERYWRFRYDA